MTQTHVPQSGSVRIILPDVATDGGGPTYNCTTLQAEEAALMRNKKEEEEALILQQFDQVKGKISGEEGWISLGPWGELSGEEYWDYKPDGPLMQITISYGCAIDSVLFESKSYDGVVIGSSVKVGRTAGDGRLTKTFCIDSSVEQLSSISLTYQLDDPRQRNHHGAVYTLCFETNSGNKYGPFGERTGSYSLSIPIQGGVITGFHGRAGAGSWLNAIGIFVAPNVNSLPCLGKKVDSLHSIQDPDSAPIQLKGKISDDEGFISLGPWGEKYGVDWTYKANGPIMQISICFGEAINSIFFRSRSCDGLVIGSSEKFGGTGGHRTQTFCINSAIEQLSSISLTYRDYKEQVVITSLCFETNIGNKYGPIGWTRGASLSIPIEGGVTVGFHGHCGTGNYLTSIGIFVLPKVNNLASSERKFDSLDSVKVPNYAPTQLKGKISDEEGFISLGPWGKKYGGDWTYKANGPIMQISICFGNAVITSIFFRSRSCDGLVIGSSEKFGSTGGHTTETFCINSAVEQLSSISLTYIDDYVYRDDNGQVAITSLCFETNIGNKYGPFSNNSVVSHASRSIPIEGGVTVGFHGSHGRTGKYLTAIGIFVASKVNNLASSERKFDSLDSVQEPNYAPTQLKSKISDEEGFISLGPWGEKYGGDWTYKPNGPIMQISICFGEAINSIFFRSRSCDGLVIGSSEEFGGTGDHTTKTKTFCIDSAVEQLSSISLTYRNYNGQVAITSLCFETNIGNKYEACGTISGASSPSIDSIPIEGGVIVGFHGHGRTGNYLTAIGIFVAPKVNNLASSERKFDSLDSVQEPNYVPTQLKQDASPRTSGRLSHSRPLNGGSLTDCPPLSPSEIDDKVLGSGVGSKPKTVETPTIKSKWSSRFLVANFKANFCGSKPKTLENIIIQNAASSSATTNKDDHHSGALSPSSEMIRMNLDLMDSAFQTEIREAPEKLKEIKADPDKKDDHHGRALSPTSKMIHSGLILLDTAFAEAEESAHHIKVKINQAHEKFKEIKADPDKKELQKTIAKLKVKIRSHNKIPSADSNPHHKNWDNINGAEDGMTHFFHKEPEVAHTGDFDGLLKDFHDLPEPLRCCLSCFFKFPPMATIKRTSMIYLWIGQGYISEYLHSEGRVGDFEVHASEIFDELIAKGFIEPIYQTCSLVPDSCKMSLSRRSCLYEEAKRRGFTSNGTLDLVPASISGDLIGHSCLINVGEAIISCEPKIFENMKHIRSLYLGRWQSSATHHIELANAKILHRLNKLNSLTFLSLRGISMITELPAFKSKLKYDLMILDLRACHNLVVIPTNIGSLKSLTHLDMSQCYFLEHMPEGLAQLSNLQVLKGFLIGDFDNNKQSCTLRDLSELPKLRKLNIYISVKDFVKLHDLKYLESFESLKKLTISWGGCSLQARDEDIAKEFGVATLPPRLQKLDLQCFPMTSLTNWLMPGKLKELKKLYIRGGQLRDLGEIQKRQAERLTVEILQLKYLSKLELHWKELRTLFPKLIYLHQVECPNLFNFQCDERGMWVDHKAIDTHVQLQKYLRTCGVISSSSMVGSGSTSTQDNCNICPVDEKQL